MIFFGVLFQTRYKIKYIFSCKTTWKWDKREHKLLWTAEMGNWAKFDQVEDWLLSIERNIPLDEKSFDFTTLFWYSFLNDISDESEACQVTGGSSKCPCQDGYEGDPCRGECQSKLALFVLTNICRIRRFLWMWEDTSFSKLERFKVVTRACHPTLIIVNVKFIFFIFDRYRRVFNEHPQL